MSDLWAERGEIVEAHEYEPGEPFVYVNGDRWELGVVSGPTTTGDGYFCLYSRGDTAANTPRRCMRSLANAGWTRLEGERDEAQRRLVRQARAVDDCVGRLRDHCGMGPIVMPVGPVQALCETVAAIVGERYDVTEEGVEFL